MAILRKIAASMGIITSTGVKRDLKLNMTTKNTPSMDRLLTLA